MISLIFLDLFGLHYTRISEEQEAGDFIDQLMRQNLPSFCSIN